MRLVKREDGKICPGPVVLVVADGVGLGPEDEGNAWHLARTPNMDRLFQGPAYGELRAHGKAVGLPSDDDLGNSEVGHNALGAGRIFDQGAKLVANAFADGSLFEGETWGWLREAAQQEGAALHLMGLYSDGNVHSHLDHVSAMMKQAKADGISKVRLHLLLDGRDVPPHSADGFLEALEAELAALRGGGFDVQIASGGGRMVLTMDRYEADWSMVARGWAVHVEGEGRAFGSALEAVETYRAEKPGIIDQDLPGFVIVDAAGQPLGKIQDGDAVIFFNFRGDRALEITRAFETPAGEALPFERGRVPRVRFAGMMQYDGDLNLPSRYLVSPPVFDQTLGEFLSREGMRQVAISETQKFGHVTYFFNGNNSEPFDAALETYLEIPSDLVDFWERPWMKAAEITDAVLEAIDTHQPDFVRINYPNGDMVGHTGHLEAAVISMEALDLSLGRLIEGVEARQGLVIVLADHGNCEEMFERDKKSGQIKKVDGVPVTRTSHTTNPVPFGVTGHGVEALSWAGVEGAGLANVAAACLILLGFEPPSFYEPSVLVRK